MNIGTAQINQPDICLMQLINLGGTAYWDSGSLSKFPALRAIELNIIGGNQ